MRAPFLSLTRLIAGTNLTGRITGALTDGKFTDARILLAEMRIRGEEPKLGALCRWVRDLDVISGLSTIPTKDGSVPIIERSPEDKTALAVLDAVLRVSGPIDNNPSVKPYPGPDVGIALQSIWDNHPPEGPSITEQVYASVLDKTIFQSAPPDLSKNLRILETTPALERKPPNHHDAILYASADNTIPMASPPPTIDHRPHPHVPGLSIALNALTPSECKAIIAAGETVTFLPDAPVRPDRTDISILAHNFYWVCDQAFHDTLWGRISPCLPASMPDGRKARGLNRRFRVYRYVPGAEYRAHIDGAWPPSGIQPATATSPEKYIYDASPPDKKQSSLFTFLIYLNDDFEGGETTFFVPAAREGVLNAYAVRPVMGAVAIFPHGDSRGALLHEGTGVRKGAKYVIRTEVEFDVEPTKDE